ncbi:MAG TPA: amidohydrolase family protein [Paracoccus sp. (in: a-proteobacteria)]|uniref:metal-dependent hydrolase family protein n=1 Tax=uncultured Paracoccus sp. TaxID=189685 RepID=UPI00262B9834|nr:amidohydrolase family protein [uncultured Paracoccus sp.]HMQ40817.1 amidohydrolase family protein [Paracoccus sp. (in: a-proteobacteria)]HMR35498.1 amidohydrolase family protein [Paracoccus sp. (in: a-proteobacteria)]
MTTMLIRNARIVDGTSPEATDPVDIHIESGRFTEVGKGLKLTADEELDLKGGIVMPGLIDCHVHVIATSANLGLNAELPDSLVALRSAQLMRNMLMRGFTTVRDLGGATRGLQMAVEEKLVEAPRLVICGKALSQTGGHTDYRGPFHNRDVSYYAEKLGTLGRVCDGVPEVLRAAREELKGGAQYIKIMADGGVSSPSDPIGYLVFSEEEIRAAVMVAKNFGTYVSAHLYDDRAIVRALDCGVECIEHGNLISDDSIARIAREGQVIVPTNIAYEALARDGAKYGLPPESVAKIEDVREAGLEKLEKLYKAGATVGYGSDLLGGLHKYQSEEFAIRGRYLPADAVIRSATVDAAKVLRMEGEIGVIAPGAHADLVVVDGNPLDDLGLLASGGDHLSLILQGGKVVKQSTGV